MISVIIPVYNTEPYLRHCVDSVLQSTYRDFELILIDDGSTDGCLRICREYAEQDARVHVIAQANQGVSAARNRGLEVCRGDWVVFVDADDVISGELLGWIAREEDRDLLLFDFARTEEDLTAPAGETLRYDGEDALGMVRSTLLIQQPRKGGNVDFLSACAKAFRKSVIDQYGLRFDRELFGGEDTLFNIQYQLRARSSAYIPRPAYYYNLHSDSSSRRFNPRLPENHRRLLKKVRTALEEGNALPELEEAYASFALNLLTSIIFRVALSPRNPQSFREKCALCRRLREEEVFRRAMAYNGRTGTVQRRGFLFLYRLRCYWFLDIVCRVLHVIWGRKGIC